MHVPDAVVSTPVIAAGSMIAAGGIGVGLYTLKEQTMVRVAVLSSAFFVASLIHVPLGPASVHLLLTGMCGVLLGWAVFPAVAIALVLQALFFGYGGISTLGVNTTIMAVPGIMCYYAFGGALRTRPPGWSFALGFAAGACAIVLGAILLAASLALSGREFNTAAAALFVAQLPLVLVEGFVTASALAFLRKARPEVLSVHETPLHAWRQSGEVA